MRHVSHHDEPLLENAVLASLAVLLSSILLQRRGRLVRFTVPPLLAWGVFAVRMPNTTLSALRLAQDNLNKPKKEESWLHRFPTVSGGITNLLGKMETTQRHVSLAATFGKHTLDHYVRVSTRATTEASQRFRSKLQEAIDNLQNKK